MMKNTIKLSVTAAAVLLAGPGLAQDQQGAVAMLDEVVVTATKTERELKEIPTNMAVVTEEDVERVQPTDVTDLLRHVPGLVLNGMGGSKASHYAGARGIQPSSRGMLIMMDGIEMNDPSNYLSVAALPLDAIERIEVIKTPASVLYGPAAVGGVINIITKKPVQPMEGNASLTYGSFDRKEASATVSGLLANGFTYGLNYRGLDTDGFRDNNWRTQNAFTPRLGYLSDAVELDVFANIVDGEYAFPGGLPLATCQDDPTKSLQPDREGSSTTSNIGSTLNYALDDSDILKLKTSYRDNDWETEDYGFFFKGDDYNVWTGEAAWQHLAVVNGMRNSLLVGAEYRSLNNSPFMYMDDQHGSKLLSQAEIEEQITGFFMQDELSPVSSLMLNLGVRYDQIDTDFINKLKQDASFDNSHDKWSPRLGATYTVSPELSLFANYSQGIRSVNLARPAFQLKGNVEPETEESIEAGIRGLLGGALEYNAALFQVTTQDKIIQKDRYLYENAGEAESKGFELALSRELPCGFYASADYTRINAEFTDFTTSSTTPEEAASYDGRRVPLVPENIFGLTLGWKNPVYGHLSGSLRYVDEKFIDNANTLSLDDYVVVDAKYALGLGALLPGAEQWQFSLAVNNLFDETYAEYGEADGGLYVPEAVAFPADGVSVFGSLTYKF
jgi:iron complex outermembrane receptor protein